MDLLYCSWALVVAIPQPVFGYSSAIGVHPLCMGVSDLGLDRIQVEAQTTIKRFWDLALTTSRDPCLER